MEYRVIRTGQSDDHFEHALFGGGRQKGAQNKNHKYLARAWWQNKWRYAYTQAEVAALQNLGKARQAAKDTADKAKAGAAKVTKTVSDVASGKYARDVDSRADRYAESAAQRSAASKRQSASGREQHETYLTANKVAEYNEEKANKFTNKLTGKSKMYKEAATSDRNAAKTAAAESSRLMTMSRENAAAARSDAKKAAEAEAEKNTAAYKISKAAGNASRAARNAADRVSDTARDVGNRVSNAASDAKNAVTSVAERGRATAERVANRVSNASKAAGERATDTAKSATNKGKAAVEKLLNRASNTAKAVGERATDAANRATDSIDRAVDKVKDTATTAARKAAAQSVKMEYGAESPQYRAAKAQVDYDKAVDDLSEARDKYGVNSSQYKQAMRNEAAAREEKNEALKAAKLDSRKSNSEKAKERITSAASSASEKGKAAVEKLLNRASNAARSAAEKVSNSETAKNVKDKAGDLRALSSYKKEYEDTAKALREYQSSPNYQRGSKEEERLQRANEVARKAYNEMRKRTGVEAVDNKVGEVRSNISNVVDKAADSVSDRAGRVQKDLGIYGRELSTSAKAASDKGKAAAEKLLNKASNTAKDVAEKAANTSVGKKVTETAERVSNAVSDTAERVADKVADAKESAQHKIYANEMKRKYGADSLHYKDAQALLDHDKAVDDLAKAREKYGVNSSEYKAAMRKEQSTRDAMDEVHEQNLYANNAQYKKISDQASALGSYIDNMDARGGPQTAEGKANYRKAVQDLERLEAQLERMWNEDWE